MPSRYREQLLPHGNWLVTTIDPNSPCLLIYPLPEWEKIEKKIESLPTLNPAARRIQRLLVGHATELEIDGSGRILLPTLLREYAGLDKHVMLVGQGKKFELWDEGRWQTEREVWLAQKTDDVSTLPTDLQTISW